MNIKVTNIRFKPSFIYISMYLSLSHLYIFNKNIHISHSDIFNRIGLHCGNQLQTVIYLTNSFQEIGFLFNRISQLFSSTVFFSCFPQLYFCFSQPNFPSSTFQPAASLDRYFPERVFFSWILLTLHLPS